MKKVIIVTLIVIFALVLLLVGIATLNKEATETTATPPQATTPTGTPEVFRNSGESIEEREARLQEALNRSVQQEADDFELIGEYGPENKITMLFRPDSPELADAAWESDIAILVDLLKRHPTLTVVVEGHAADVVSDVDGEELSKDRARVVADILQELEVPQEQIETEVIAFDRAIGDNDTDEGRALNRRAFVYVVFQF